MVRRPPLPPCRLCLWAEYAGAARRGVVCVNERSPRHEHLVGDGETCRYWTAPSGNLIAHEVTLSLMELDRGEGT